ncbi:glycosyltransferase [Lentzea sp. BCCO 10_0061]|uniref:Glycosyltransferase n=1 Tax=Lentzea sokolovensis TaxID=3095429 RepID=A0ABU4UX35_9PSEU|nr:glycosyltransferase [Lentzea sp. BCCO 10_0061]MDX8144068.1 glycosyltransferase [Lentzea sp. BCCO 10_0061]
MSNDVVDYADGAEDSVLERLRAAADVSGGSAELATNLGGSWELSYHFSPQRLGLLAPLNIQPGQRVLDVGCGSGVLSRAMGEAGADVVGVEGVPLRAAAARERCRDLPGVRIVDSPAVELSRHGTFDLAMVCGVLEYCDPEQLLGDVADALDDDGALVLAIENQMGLGYLLGRAEDHRGKSWVGPAGYPGSGARTWNRQRLGELLADAGFTAQRWLLPYPDYKIPRIVVDAALHDRPDAPELIDKLVRDPLQGAFGGTTGAVAGRLPHRLAVADGFGAAVSPSFLVIAARTQKSVERTLRPGLAWMVNNGRLPQWRRSRTLTADLDLVMTDCRETSAGWLRQVLVERDPVLPGVALDSLLLDALADNDLPALRDRLKRWREYCAADARPATDADVRHPFLPGRDGVAVLPPDCLDVHPGNFIVAGDGTYHRIDLEWQAESGVDAELALVRALLEFAREVHRSGAAHPWPAQWTIRQLTEELTELAALPAPRWADLLPAEATLQELVSGTAADEVHAALLSELDVPGRPRLWEGPALTELQDVANSVPQLTAQITDLNARAVELNAHAVELTEKLHERSLELDELHEQSNAAADTLREEISRLDDLAGNSLMELADTDARLVEQTARAERLAQENAELRARLDKLNSSSIVHIGRDYVWPAARAVRGTRDLLLGRGGEETDAVLRRLGPIAPLVGGRIREVSKQNRAERMHYEVEVPADEIAIGRGQVVELEGTAAHDDLPVHAVAVRADGRTYPGTIGHPGNGIRLRVPVRARTSPGSVALELLVTLADGTIFRCDLPPLRVRPQSTVERVEASWPATGPKVAICLATYNPPRHHFAAQLDSIRAQTHANWVCVISDDSSDEAGLATLHDVVGDDPRFIVVEHEQNAGFYGNFERALQLVPADAEFVALSDQDDLWDADKIETMLAEFADPSVLLAYCNMRLVDDNGTVITDRVWQDRPDQITDLEQLLLLNTVTGAASMVRADVLAERMLPLPPSTPASYHDQWLAACALSIGRIAFVDRALHSYRQHGANVTGWQVPRLADGLPGLKGLARYALGLDQDALAHKQPELDHIVEHETRRIAQFATVLLMRNHDLMPPETVQHVSRLTTAERRLWPLVRLALEGDRPDTAGAERRLLAAALLRRAQR